MALHRRNVQKFLWEAQTLDLLNTGFKSIVVNMLKDIMKTMDKELKELRRILSQLIENTGKETEIIKRYQIEILELKNTMTRMQSLLEGFNNRFEQAEARIRRRNKQEEET